MSEHYDISTHNFLHRYDLFGLHAILINASTKKFTRVNKAFSSHVIPLEQLLPYIRLVHSSEQSSFADAHLFKNYLRVTPELLTYLLGEKIKAGIERQVTNMRVSISAGARLEAILLCSLKGASYSSLQLLTWISKQSLSIIVPETCTAIYEGLKDNYLKVKIIYFYNKNLFHRIFLKTM